MAQTPEKTRPGLKQEALAVLGIFVALFFLLSLVSESLHFSTNICGDIGRLVAQVVLGFTGVGAYLLVVLLFVLSFLFFSPRMSFERLPHVTSGLTFAVISFCGLLSSLSIYESARITPYLNLLITKDLLF
jgi:S-DNA-T family DNA segregation ATPase FtsK/SpoIIIE